MPTRGRFTDALNVAKEVADEKLKHNREVAKPELEDFYKVLAIYRASEAGLRSAANIEKAAKEHFDKVKGNKHSSPDMVSLADKKYKEAVVARDTAAKNYEQKRWEVNEAIKKLGKEALYILGEDHKDEKKGKSLGSESDEVLGFYREEKAARKEAARKEAARKEAARKEAARKAEEAKMAETLLPTGRSRASTVSSTTSEASTFRDSPPPTPGSALHDAFPAAAGAALAGVRSLQRQPWHGENIQQLDEATRKALSKEMVRADGWVKELECKSEREPVQQQEFDATIDKLKEMLDKNVEPAKISIEELIERKVITFEPLMERLEKLPIRQEPEFGPASPTPP